MWWYDRPLAHIVLQISYWCHCVGVFFYLHTFLKQWLKTFSLYLLEESSTDVLWLQSIFILHLNQCLNLLFAWTNDGIFIYHRKIPTVQWLTLSRVQTPHWVHISAQLHGIHKEEGPSTCSWLNTNQSPQFSFHPCHASSPSHILTSHSSLFLFRYLGLSSVPSTLFHSGTKHPLC